MSNASPLTFSFTKMQGVGNDFVVVDSRDLPPDADWPALALALCDRHFGVGADGLMVFSPSLVADFRARMYNPDGTEDFCGNGTRCLLRFAYEKNLVSFRRKAGRHGDDAHATIETKAGIRTGEIRLFPDGGIDALTLSMGVPRFAPADLPMSVSDFPVRDFPLSVGEEIGEEIVPISVVSIGTTHSIVWVDFLPDDETFFRLSPLIENHPLFPERTSVMWTQVVEFNAVRAAGDDYFSGLRLRIWERGAGETLGCGSGACAAAVLARLARKVSPDGAIAVSSKGGELSVDWEDYLDREVILTGPAEFVYSGVWEGRAA